MASPEYLICLECECPCYTFEWEEGEATDAFCQNCANDDPTQFATPDEFDSMSGGK